MSQFVYEIIADAQKYVQGMELAAASGSRVKQVHDELAAIGVKTTQQFQAELREIEKLTVEAGRDKLAVAGLTQAKQRLVDQMESLLGATKQLTVADLQLNSANRLVDASTKQFVSTSKARSNLTQELNALGIRTAAQMQEEAREVDLLTRVYQGDAQVVAQLTERKKMLASGISGVRATSFNATQAMFQLGFAMNDATQFSYGMASGMRAVANNVQPLAMMLGASGWLILGLAAVSTAMVVFGDDIEDALRVKGVHSANEFKDALGRLVDVRDEAFNFAQPINNIEQLDQYLDILQHKIDGMSDKKLGMASFGAHIALELEDKFPIYQKWFNMFGYGLDNLKQHINDNSLLGGLEKFAKELGLTREQMQLMHDLAQKMDSVGDPFVDLKFPGEGDEKKHETLLEKEIEHRKELRAALDELRGPQGVHIAQIQVENDELKRLVEQTERLNRIRAENGGNLGIDFQYGFTGASVLGTQTNVIKPKYNKDGSEKSPLRTFTDETIRDMDRLDKAMREKLFKSLEKFDDLAKDLSHSLQTGLGSAIYDLASSLPALAEGTTNITAVAEQAVGQFAETMGKTLIGFGLSGIAIKAFPLRPELALAAGAALVAIGAELEHAARAKATAFTGGGSGGGGASAYYYGSGYGQFYAGNHGGQYPTDIPNRPYGGSTGGAEVVKALQDSARQTERMRETLDRIDRGGIPAYFNRGEYGKAGEESARMNRLTGTV